MKKVTWGAVIAVLVAAGILGYNVLVSYCQRNPSDPACAAINPSPTPLPTPTPLPSPSPSPSTPAPTPSPTPVPTATPTASPTPSPSPVLTCRGGTCPLSALYVNAKKHGGMNHDSTMRCRDQKYCEASTGIKGTTDCALGNEGSPDRAACEELHAPGCHRWYYWDAGVWHQCLPGEHPVASCDHYDRWVEWKYSDPSCKHTGCPTVYNPYTGHCSTYPVMKPGGKVYQEPLAGFEVVPRGKTKFMACGWGYSEKVCSRAMDVDQ